MFYKALSYNTYNMYCNEQDQDVFESFGYLGTIQYKRAKQNA